MAMNSEQRALKSEINGSQWRLDFCHSAQLQAIFDRPIHYFNFPFMKIYPSTETLPTK